MQNEPKRYRPTEMECRCEVCGDRITHPALWIDTIPPSKKCPEGATVVTNCPTAMNRAKVSAWLLKEAQV